MYQQLRCPSCNSVSLKEDGRFYVCEYCGGKIPKPSEQITASVTSEDGVNSLLERARLYWDLGERTKSQQLYRQILDLDATNEEAQQRAR